MKSVAIIGASSDRRKFGNKAVRAFVSQGYEVFPINPNEREVEGLKTYGSVLDLPKRPDWMSVYVPPPVLLKLLPDLAKCGCDELWLNPGTESDAVMAKAEELQLPVVRGCSILAIGVSPARL